MPSPVITTPPGFGFPSGQPLTAITVPVNIPCQAWAFPPATRIQDGSGGTNPIQFTVDGGGPINVTLTSPPGTVNPMFSVPLTAANTGGAAGARLAHAVAITVQDDAGQNTTVTLTVLRTN